MKENILGSSLLGTQLERSSSCWCTSQFNMRVLRNPVMNKPMKQKLPSEVRTAFAWRCKTRSSSGVQPAITKSSSCIWSTHKSMQKTRDEVLWKKAAVLAFAKIACARS